jgi:hypothetical protein
MEVFSVDSEPIRSILQLFQVQSVEVFELRWECDRNAEVFAQSLAQLEYEVDFVLDIGDGGSTIWNVWQLPVDLD